MKREKGFILVTMLMVMMLMTSMLSAICLQVIRCWSLSTSIESQLHSRVLAENGVEYAASILSGQDLNDLLLGVDNRPCVLSVGGWRNPVALELAMSSSLIDWPSTCDDGLPVGIPSVRGERINGMFLIRFSNNPGEDPFSDRDGVVLVRSMGISPRRLNLGDFPEVVNHVTVLEAVFQVLNESDQTNEGLGSIVIRSNRATASTQSAERKPVHVESCQLVRRVGWRIIFPEMAATQ